MKTIALGLLMLITLGAGCGGTEKAGYADTCVHQADCTDGMVCVGTEGKPGTVCLPQCHTAADCGGTVCAPLLGIDEFGVCVIR